MKDKDIRPIVKWVGGKRQVMNEIIKHVPNDFNTYYEPFIGGAAVLFEIQPKKAVINDINIELINMYITVKNEVDKLIIDLKKHRNTKEYYYSVRGLDRDIDTYNELSNVEKASRLIYLNKTCYNGLYRVNRKGQFNTPYGKYVNPNIVNENGLRVVHTYFKNNNIVIKNESFASAVSDAKRGDFVYFDPPYDPVSSSSSFTSYSKEDFGRKDQIMLKETCDLLNSKGVKFLLSNSATDFIIDLYKEYSIELIDAKRSINSKGNGRGSVKEVLIKNYE